MKHSMLFAIATVFAMAAPVAFAGECAPLSLKESADAAPRAITVADQLSVRRIDVLKVSPDLRRYAMLVRQADAVANRYCRSWFIGDVQGGAPVLVGDGGETNLALGMNNRYVGGEYDKPAMRWSPDGSSLAYKLTRDGEAQVWVSRADGSSQQQLTRNAADVDQLEWSTDGKSIYFTVGTPRAELQARAEARERSGYHYDSELVSFTDFMLPRHDGVEPDTTSTVWIVSPSTRQERVASEQERSAFERARARSGSTDVKLPIEAETVDAFAERADGAQAWAARSDSRNPLSKIGAVIRKGARPIACRAEQCTGYIPNIWWRKDGTLMFLRAEGIEYSAWGLYAWSPKKQTVSALLRVADDVLTNCQQTASDTLLCVRETPSQPLHVAAIDLTSGSVSILADVNPEFRHIRLGRVERFEWDTPKFAWNAPGAPLVGAYGERAFGYILYPPDFTANRKYPVFMSPYAANGFDNITNWEYPLHALAAQGFVVISSSFPVPGLEAQAQLGEDFATRLYSAELGFPHMSMSMDSTLKALDVVAARGFIDEARVGIGSLSHGAAVPLHTMIDHDRFAAVTLSTGGWDAWEYYVLTRQGRARIGVSDDWIVKPDAASSKFWKQISLAENVDAIEAPILFNVTAAELFGIVRLVRHMEDAGKPYDAYVFPRETHVKYQPAHLDAIMHRNVDWLRFWLQSYEDPAPEKAVQYERWRKLREMQNAQRARLRSSVATPSR